MVHLLPDQMLIFPLTAPWRFWQRRTAAAQVIALDDAWSIVHLRVAAPGRCLIAHLPIVERYALIQAQIVGRSSATATPLDAMSDDAVVAWRAAHRQREAGAFALPLAHAISLIYQIAPDLGDDTYIESAYPIADETGAYRIVRVVTAPAG